MQFLSSSQPVHLCCQPVDIRKNFDGLSAIVVNGFKKDPLRDGIFVFVNKSRDNMKLLVWDRHGFWLHYKRLEGGILRLFQRASYRTPQSTYHRSWKVPHP